MKWTDFLPYNRWGDYIHAAFRFRKRMGRWPNRSRRTWNDEFFGLKTSDEVMDPLRVFISDKEYVKLFIRAVIGEKYNVPTSRIIKSIDELQEFQVDQPCCVKPTHMSGQVIFAKPGEEVDLDRIRGWFSKNYYHSSREANYRYLKPKVIIEPLIFGSDNVEDIKFYCFNGQPKVLQMDHDRYGDHRRSIMNMNWEKMPFSIRKPPPDEIPPVPETFEKMKDFSALVAGYFDGQVRVDFYAKGNTLYLGEITNITSSASTPFREENGEYLASRVLLD